jgi:hypothetical protein
MDAFGQGRLRALVFAGKPDAEVEDRGLDLVAVRGVSRIGRKSGFHYEPRAWI